ncbi:MAG: DUF3488 domain-containing protein [Deltaproteobacteria bacterium]|nr:DUF3488 domain-containing protein [Deltaproteobacteria bacterium]
MRFNSYITAITCLMVAVGFAATCLVEELSPAFLVFAGAAAITSLAINVRVMMRPRTSVSAPAGTPAIKKAVEDGWRAVFNVMAALAFALFLADYYAISQTLAAAASRFLAILALIKLYDLRSTRDYVILFTIVFFQLIGAAASTVSPFFFAVLSAFVISAIWAMVVFNIKRDFEKSSPSEDIPAGIFGARFFLSTLAVAFGSLAITLALFFALPRMGVGLFEKKTLRTVKVSGFSEKVRLGELGPVKLDPTVVMRVEVPDGIRPLQTLYLRGAALDYYDGESWNRESGGKELLRKNDRGAFTSPSPMPAAVKTTGNIHPAVPDGPPAVPDGHPAGHTKAAAGEMVEYRIMLEPLETEVIFTPGLLPAWPTGWVEISGRFNYLWTDASDTLYLSSPPYSRIEYTVTVNQPALPAGKDGGRAVKDLSPYLALPPAVLDGPPEAGAIKELSLRITEGAGGDAEKAVAVESYLRTNYRYTLDPRKGAGKTPLDDFLFFTKEGYCEQYSTAMVILLRTAGIPARLVTGFSQGQWNGFGGYFLIRQQDAHSWVEAYIEGQPSRTAGWVRFDPTPAAGIITPFSPLPVSLYLDSLRWRWTRYVIGYSFSDQIRISRAIEAKASGLQALIKTTLNSVKDGWLAVRDGVLAILKPSNGQWRRTTALFFVLFAAAATVFLAAVKLRWKRGAKNPKTPWFYLDMLRILGQAGFKKKGPETPREFAQRCAVPEAMRLTEAYEGIRYGGVRPEEAEKAEIRRLIESLRKKNLRRPSGTECRPSGTSVPIG